MFSNHSINSSLFLHKKMEEKRNSTVIVLADDDDDEGGGKETNLFDKNYKNKFNRSHSFCLNSSTASSFFEINNRRSSLSTTIAAVLSPENSQIPFFLNDPFPQSELNVMSNSSGNSSGNGNISPSSSESPQTADSSGSSRDEIELMGGGGGMGDNNNIQKKVEETTTIEVKPTESSITNTTNNNTSLLIPFVAVLSANYNFSVLAVSMYIMKQKASFFEVTQNSAIESTIKMLVYSGAILGQFSMGYLGDLVGRRAAMCITLVLAAMSSLFSAVITWGPPFVVLVILGLTRFFLGVGSGGVYPLSAVSAAEGTVSSKVEDRRLRVSWTYFASVPGIILPYVLAAIVWNLSSSNSEVTWRVLMAAGSLPIFLILWNAQNCKDSEEFRKSRKEAKIWKALINPKYWRHLVGSGVCWFLYDIVAYGIILVQPEITERLFLPRKMTVNDVIWSNVVLNSISLPAVLSGILIIKQMGIKWLQFWGFIGIGFSALLMAILYNPLKDSLFGLFVVLGIINFFINWGCAISTFIISTEIYPPECRATYNGISAAMGKLGAVVGIYSLNALLVNFGIIPMMGVAAFVSCFAAVLTWFFVGVVPKTINEGCAQCFGSLLGCIPFCDFRAKMGWKK